MIKFSIYVTLTNAIVALVLCVVCGWVKRTDNIMLLVSLVFAGGCALCTLWLCVFLICKEG